MKYEQLAEACFAGLTVLPFPIFLGGYPGLAAAVFLVLLAAAGVSGLAGQVQSEGRAQPEPEDRRSRTPAAS